MRRESLDDELRQARARIAHLEGQVAQLTGATPEGGRAQAVFRVSQALAEADECSDPIQTAVDIVAGALECDRVMVILVDLEARAVTGLYAAGPGRGSVYRASFEEYWSGLSGWAMRERRPAISARGAADPREGEAARASRAATQVGAVLVVPIVGAAGTLGTLTVINRPEQRDFTDDDIAVVSSLASQMASAVQQQRLLVALAAEAEERRRAQAEVERAVAERTAELAAANRALEVEVAERRRAEGELRESEERYRGLFELLANGIIYSDADGRVTYANPAAEHILGASLAEMREHTGPGASWTMARADGAIIPADQAPHAVALATGRPVLDTLVGLEDRDGQTRWAVVNSIPQLRDGAARPDQVITTITDITERKRVEAALLESRARFRSLFENSPISLWDEDFSAVRPELERLRAAGLASAEAFEAHLAERPELVRALAGLVTVQDVNRATVEMMEAADKAALLGPLSRTLSDEGAEAFRRLLASLAAGRHAYEGDQILVTADGRRKHLLLSMTLAPGHEASLSHVLVSMIDVTARRQAERALRASEARFSAIFRSSPVGTMLTHFPDGTILNINEAFLRLLDVPPDQAGQVIGRTTVELGVWETEKRGRFMEILRERGQVRNHVGVLHQRTGGRLDVLLSVELLALDGDQFLLTVVHDITATLSAERARRESEELYRSLVESQESTIATIDADGRYHYLNQIAARGLGGDPADFVGRLMQDLFPPTVADHQLGSIRQVIATGAGIVSEARSVVAGRPRWYRTSIQPIRDAGGGVRLALINAVDITERKEAELVLEERVRARTAELEGIRQRLVLATSAAALGVWDWSPQTGEMIWDDQMLRLYGITRADFDGTVRSWERGLHPDDMPEQLEVLGRALRREAEFLTSFRVVWPDGSVHMIKAAAITLFDAAGQPERMIGVNYDVTAQSQAEAVLRSSEETLRRANSELERAMRMKDEFLASMSHELRTPLTGILGLSEAMQMETYGTLSERQLRALRNIEASGRHLLELINDILDVSKMEAGRLELQVEGCDLDEICAASLEMIRGLARAKRQQVAFAIRPATIRVSADARRLKQILVNLLSNAVKFTPEGGSLGLEALGDPGGQLVRITVWDRGIGIAEQDLGKLFQPFTQLDSSLSRQHAGTGLGLVLVQRLAQLHGGAVSVESQPGEGSRFTVTLPTLPPAPARAHLSAAAEPLRIAPPAAAQAPRDGPLVMVVDDNDINIDVVSDYLLMKGMRVEVARGGQELLDALPRVRPDIILLDIQMPGMDGTEALRHIRASADPQLAAVPVIAVTALAMPGDRERCLAAGASEYVSKPVSLGELLRAIQSQLRPGAPR